MPCTITFHWFPRFWFFGGHWWLMLGKTDHYYRPVSSREFTDMQTMSTDRVSEIYDVKTHRLVDVVCWILAPKSIFHKGNSFENQRSKYTCLQRNSLPEKLIFLDAVFFIWTLLIQINVWSALWNFEIISPRAVWVSTLWKWWFLCFQLCFSASQLPNINQPVRFNVRNLWNPISTHCLHVC